jgi:hypothetical protein
MILRLQTENEATEIMDRFNGFHDGPNRAHKY